MMSNHAFSAVGVAPQVDPVAGRPTALPQPVWLNRDSQWKWALILFLAVLDFTWSVFTDFKIHLQALLAAIGCEMILWFAIWFYTRIRLLPDQRVAETIHASAVMIAFALVALPFSYLIASLALPTIDPDLITADAWLGFDWALWYRWVVAHPHFEMILSYLYKSSGIQIYITVIFLGFMGRVLHVKEMVAALILTLLPIIVLSGLMPAVCGWVYFGIGLEKAYHLAHFEGLRDGSYRTLWSSMVGIVTFPSFHTAMAIIVPWAYRGVPWLFWPVSLVNLGVLISLPSEGGHYLSDIVVGAIITVTILAWLRRFYSITLNQEKNLFS